MKLFQPRYCKNIPKFVDFYSSFNPSPLSIKQFIDFGKSHNPLFENITINNIKLYQGQ